LMARLPEREYTYFTTVRGMCRHCRRETPARVFFREKAVWQEALCPECANEGALIAADQAWYLENCLGPFPDRAPLTGACAPRLGCPHDCGPCTWHASPCQLPVNAVTNVCNLRCPICFTYNRPERPYYMAVEEFRETLDRLISRTGPLDLVNITGGEPTLHPELFQLLAAARRPEIGRVTLNSNGLLFAADPGLCARVAEAGAHVILSLHSLERKANLAMHGRDLTAEKRRAVENLTRAGVRLTILNVLARGLNEEAPGRILDLMRENDLILSLTIQTMTYTGQGGGQFARARHIPVDEAARMVCAQSGGEIEFSDFLPRPSTHPLCYLVSYLLKTDRSYTPLTRLAPRQELLRRMGESYLLRLDDQEEFFRRAIDEQYAGGRREELAKLRRLVETLYPPGEDLGVFERQRRAETAVRTVCIHAHMDEDSFDASRAMLCPDLVPVASGALVPACTYNLFHRRKDERFYVER